MVDFAKCLEGMVNDCKQIVAVHGATTPAASTATTATAAATTDLSLVATSTAASTTSLDEALQLAIAAEPVSARPKQCNERKVEGGSANYKAFLAKEACKGKEEKEKKKKNGSKNGKKRRSKRAKVCVREGESQTQESMSVCVKPIPVCTKL